MGKIQEFEKQNVMCANSVQTDKRREFCDEVGSRRREAAGASVTSFLDLGLCRRIWRI